MGGRYRGTPWNTQVIRYSSEIAYTLDDIERLKAEFKAFAKANGIPYVIIKNPPPKYYLERGALAEIILYEKRRS